MTPAAHHLLAALHELEGRDDALLGSLTQDEWTAVADLAIRQRVGPLLLSRPGLPLPGPVRDQLRKRAEASAFRVLRQVAALRQISDRLEPQGIQLIALKGIHLATTVYASPSLREMNDIDVMVRREHLEAAAAVMDGLGYRPLGQPMSVDVALKASHHLPRYLNGRDGVELHWRLARPGSPPLVEPDELWSRARPSKLGPNVLALAPEDVLVHLCVHAGIHHFEQGVRPLCDLRALILTGGNRLQWTAVAERAERWGCARSVALALTLVRSGLGVQLPVDLPAEVSAAPADVADLALAHAFAPAAILYDTSEPAGRLLGLRTASAKVRHLFDRIFLPPEEMATLYPHMGSDILSRAAVIPRRIGGLLARHGQALLSASWNPGSELRQGLDRRNALAAWIRGDGA